MYQRRKWLGVLLTVAVVCFATWNYSVPIFTIPTSVNLHWTNDSLIRPMVNFAQRLTNLTKWTPIISQSMTTSTQLMERLNQPVAKMTQPRRKVTQPMKNFSQPMKTFTQSMTKFTRPMTNSTQNIAIFTQLFVRSTQRPIKLSQNMTTFTKSMTKSIQNITTSTESVTKFTGGMTTFSGSMTHCNQRITNLTQHLPNFTIVTAYFNLRGFQKGSTTFTPELYKGWANVFSRLYNNLVVYTDDLTFKQIIEDIRIPLKAHTSVVFIQNRTSLWAFQLRPRIQTIFADPNYPKHHPNTVLADYPCSQHAKYEVVARTIRDRTFPATYYAWLDVGYFRDIVDKRFNFSLHVPGDLDGNKIAYTKIADGSLSVEPETLIKQNSLWIGGGMFIGTPKTLLTYFEQYKRAVHVFLDQRLMNSDQQMVYGMFTDKGRQMIKPTVDVQLYTPNEQGNPWFYLGFHCLRKLNDTCL